MRAKMRVVTIILFLCDMHTISCAGKDRDVLFQVSTMKALTSGACEGSVSLTELRRHGNFGIGVFDEVYGQLICVGGTFYQTMADGNLRRAALSARTAFAMVTHFDADRTFLLNKELDLQQLESFLDGALSAKDRFHAIYVMGTFAAVRMDGAFLLEKPDSTSADNRVNLPKYEMRNIKGTLVGFHVPSFMQEVTPLGYQFSFLSADKSRGGQVVSLRLKEVRIEVDEMSEFHLMLPAPSQSSSKTAIGNEPPPAKNY